MSAIYDCPTCGTPIEGRGEKDPNELVRVEILYNPATEKAWLNEISEDEFQSGVEAMFNGMWHSATSASKETDKRSGYTKALNFLYNSYSDFSTVVSRDKFYFRYGASRGGSQAFFDTDPTPGIDAREDPSLANKVGITVFNETVQDISNKKYSFGYEVRAFYHETVHVQQAFLQPAYSFTKYGEGELNAYYRTMTNSRLPLMTSEENQSQAQSAISEFMTRIPNIYRADAYKTFGRQIDYFLNTLGKEKATKIRAIYKF
jgi:hypothetical protein